MGILVAYSVHCDVRRSPFCHNVTAYGRATVEIAARTASSRSWVREEDERWVCPACQRALAAELVKA